MPWKPINPGKKKEQRLGSYYRGYDNRWRSFRKRYLRAHPVCVVCERAAEVIDHIIAWDGNPETLIQEDNLQALCTRCHNKKTAKYDMRKVYEYNF